MNPTDLLGPYLSVATHVHSQFASNPTCSGANSVVDLVEAASKLGFTGIAFAEHTTDPKVPELTTKYLPLFERKIAEVHAATNDDVELWTGAECNLFIEGHDDLPPSLRTELEYIIASQHGGLGESEKDSFMIAERITDASARSYIDTIGHPSRNNAEVKVNWERILEVMLLGSTMAEINLNCLWKGDAGNNRFWYNWLLACAKTGVPLVIGLDVHNAGMWPLTDHTEDWHTPIWLLQSLTQLLESVGIRPEQVINSSNNRWATWLETPKPERAALIDW